MKYIIISCRRCISIAIINILQFLRIFLLNIAWLFFIFTAEASSYHEVTYFKLYRFLNGLALDVSFKGNDSGKTEVFIPSFTDFDINSLSAKSSNKKLKIKKGTSKNVQKIIHIYVIK